MKRYTVSYPTAFPERETRSPMAAVLVSAAAVPMNTVRVTITSRRITGRAGRLVFIVPTPESIEKMRLVF
jgi:hypothetical protein